MATLTQPMEALNRANQIRLARADLRRKLANRQVTAAQLLEDPPEAVLSWKVGEMLSCQRRWGSIRTRKFLQSLGEDGRPISWHREIGVLTERQRAELVRRLGA